MKITTILSVTCFVSVYGGILPPPWADPARNKCAEKPGGWLLLYWPQDEKCYRIFHRGFPCPATMELSPVHNDQNQIVGECNCPPRTARNSTHDICYPIYTKGPCERGQYFAPLSSSTKKRMGHCLKVEQCRQNEAFWPLTNECFPKYSRGPCPEGQLIVMNKDTLIAECQCSKSGPLSKYFWPQTKTCHQYYTKGPCLEKGTLFLPGPTCGCHQFLPNFDPKTKRCFEIGSRGPCNFGQIFTLDPETMKSSCVCKPEHVPWHDGHCYRLYTRGPCNATQILVSPSECRDNPCPKGKLYFPEDDSCYRVGVRGPCGRGQLVLFEQSVKPSTEGISYRGVCGCSGPNNCNVSEESTEAELLEGRNIHKFADEQELQGKPANVTIDLSQIRICEKEEDPAINNCYRLYTEGPCVAGEWLVPVRQGRGDRQVHRFGHAAEYEQLTYQYVKHKVRVRCDCKPGFTKDKKQGSCRIPLITLAQFLNVNKRYCPPAIIEMIGTEMVEVKEKLHLRSKLDGKFLNTIKINTTNWLNILKPRRCVKTFPAAKNIHSRNFSFAIILNMLSNALYIL